MPATMEPPVKDIYLPAPASVLEAKPLTPHETYFKFRMEDGEPLNCMPGQFMEVSVPGIGEAPISISSSPTRCDERTVEMVVRKVGRVSGALHALGEGDRVGLRGPYGTCFPVDGAMKGRDLLFVCGGIGLVPVRSAIHYVLDRRDDYGEVTILFGTRTPEDRLFTDELYEWKTRKDVTFIETVDVADKEWGGNVGVITTLFPRIQVNAAQTTTIVCGPPIMYKFVLLELHKIGVVDEDIYVSLERHMRCGVGKCGHCQINGMYACQEGAVFKYADIVTVREAI
jgi:sulfite reductase subunit B